MGGDAVGRTLLSADEVRQACGDLSDATVEAIIATGATTGDLEAAVLWETRSFETRDETQGLSSPAAEVREILEQNAAWDDEAGLRE